MWLQFDGGLGSLLFLKILPALILLSFAAIVAYVVYLLVHPIFDKDQSGGGVILSALRLLAGTGGAYLAILALINTGQIFGASYPYGEPQTWLTLPFWNSFFLMAVLVWIQTGFAMVIPVGGPARHP